MAVRHLYNEPTICVQRDKCWYIVRPVHKLPCLLLRFVRPWFDWKSINFSSPPEPNYKPRRLKDQQRHRWRLEDDIQIHRSFEGVSIFLKKIPYLSRIFRFLICRVGFNFLRNRKIDAPPKFVQSNLTCPIVWLFNEMYM